MHLCAGSNDKNSCFSDRGGLLTVQENGLHTVVGVTRGNYWACIGPGNPEVFARVTASLDWIQCVLHGTQDLKCFTHTTTTDIPDNEASSATTSASRIAFDRIRIRVKTVHGGDLTTMYGF